MPWQKYLFANISIWWTRVYTSCWCEKNINSPTIYSMHHTNLAKDRFLCSLLEYKWCDISNNSVCLPISSIKALSWKSSGIRYTMTMICTDFLANFQTDSWAGAWQSLGIPCCDVTMTKITLLALHPVWKQFCCVLCHLLLHLLHCVLCG